MTLPYPHAPHLPPVSRIIPERWVEGRRLGRHIEHDPRSRAFPHPAPASVTEWAPLSLASRRWTLLGPFLDQGELGSCTCNAIVNVLNAEPFADGSRPALGEDDAVKLYELATTLDDIPGTYPPDDTGSSGIAACKAAQQSGLIASYSHAFSMLAALHWLSTRGGVIIGIDWFDSFDTPSGPFAELVIAPGSLVRGGHELALLEIDVDARAVRGVNSWGEAWGDHGWFTMTWDTLAILLARQGDATLPAGP